MSTVQRLLLIPCLAPLLAVLALCATNIGAKTRLRLLAWTSPPLPLGAWTALTASGGAAGAALTAFLLIPAERPLRRTRHSPAPSHAHEPESAVNEAASRSTTRQGPERDVREPAPTVSVAYRVIQPPPSASRQQQASSSGSGPQNSTDWGDDPEANW
ncbi:hypothetical protein KR52_09935 [Synechococcus sp. KORDI-52]|uniref:hypothetical protein n=1 Tax=Synechococcus sp. KORDI-52 TaxID=585425 RepID=UPI0004E09B4B|nr:hypothetical protein [Synechococcus sp. KORDI-52]AII49459.1 hypothetical protein KR52_09935 [Synechococcus sp. KORDI-52]